MSDTAAAANDGLHYPTTVKSAYEALEALHSLGVAHCDVRAANMLLKPDGSVILIDFGHARLDAGAEDMSQDSLNLSRILSSVECQQRQHKGTSEDDEGSDASENSSVSMHINPSDQKRQILRPSALSRGRVVAHERKMRLRGSRPVQATYGKHHARSLFRLV